MKKSFRFLSLLLALLFAAPLLPARAEKNAGVVRVLLTRLNLTDRMELSLDGSYTISGISFQRGSDLVISCAGGSLIVYYEGMALDAGQEVTLRRHQVREGQENGLRINGGYELHPGDLVVSVKNGQLRAVLHAPVEEYLLGVVPYEMSDSFPLEALKAQAVTARTYALRKAGAEGDYDVVDNTNDQAYYGVKPENTSAARAIEETRGVCGYYHGALAECFYSASNGGQTELVSHVWGSGDYSYLAMADDPYDLENPESVVKSYSFPREMESVQALGPLADNVLGLLSEAMEGLGYDGDTESIRIIGLSSAEVALPMYQDSPSRVMTLLKLSLIVQGRKLLTGQEEEEISLFAAPPTAAPAEKQPSYSAMQTLPVPVTVALDLFPGVENALDLSINGGSNEIMTIRETDSAFILESRRYGHGVGMSQRGAQQMAGAYGWTYEQILRFYYPGMELKTLSYSFALPTPVSRQFLSTPGPAATPTPRPTLMPVSATPGPGQYLAAVTNIGVNSYLNLRAQTNTQSSVLRQLYYGQQLLVMEDLGEWLRVKTDDAEGYVMSSFVTKLEAE